jgi:hypothetical protein
MIGTTLSHYRVEDSIGQGGMGVVYRAIDTRLGRVVAVKVIAAGAAGWISFSGRSRHFNRYFVSSWRTPSTR